MTDDLFSALGESALSIVLYTGKHDLKLAAEIGAAVLLDKPILLIVEYGVDAPDKLADVVDEIVWVHMRSDEGRHEMAAAVKDFIDRLRP